MLARTILLRRAFCQHNASAVAAARFISGDSSITVNPASYVPPAPPSPPSELASLDTSAFSEMASKLPLEPTSDLGELGLGCWYTPPGIVENALDFVHSSTGMPWWLTIVACTATVRALMFPVAIISQRRSAAMREYMPLMTAAQEKLRDASNRNDMIEMGEAAKELQAAMKLCGYGEGTKGVFKGMSKTVGPMLIQLPVFIGFFIGLRHMAYAPVASMQQGGFGWITDLTVGDPYYILPIATMITLSAVIELGADFGAAVSTKSGAMKWVIRCAPLGIGLFMMNFPAAVVFYWATTNLFSLTQVAFLRIPLVKKYFAIAPKPAPTVAGVPKTKLSFMQKYRKGKSDKRADSAVQQVQIDDERAFRAAGIGPIRKTYKYNPTLVKKRD